MAEIIVPAGLTEVSRPLDVPAGLTLTTADQPPVPTGLSEIQGTNTLPDNIPFIDDPVPSTPERNAAAAGTSVGRMMDAFGEGASFGWGEDNIGLDPETEKALSEAGIFRDGEGGYGELFKSFNEILLRPAASALDLIMKGGEAVLFGGAELAGQISVELGGSEAMGKRLTRDTLMLAETFGIVAGVAPTSAVPRVGKLPNKAVKGREAGARSRTDTPANDSLQPKPIPDPEQLDLPLPNQATPKPGDVEFAGNINLNRIDAPEDVKDLIRETAEANNDFQGARRGTQTFAETEALADSMGLTVRQLVSRQKGQALNAEELLASRDVLVQASTEVARLAALRRAGDKSEKLAEEFLTATLRHAAIQEQVAGATAEAGRALSAMRIAAKENRAAEDLAEVVKQIGGGDDKLDELADAIGALETDQQIAAVARNFAKSGMKDKFLEVWINGLLSGPQTHGVNIASNSLVASMSIVEQQVAGVIGTVRRLRPGAAEEGVELGEGAARAFGSIRGLVEGLPLAAKAFRTEVPGDLTKLDVPRQQAIGGITGKIIRVPGRLLQGADEFFKSVGYRQELNTLAYRQATTEGLTGANKSRRISELTNEPTADMIKIARESARVQTFTNELGRFGKSLTSLIDAAPLGTGRIIVPFIRTPTNIVKFAAKRSPLGIASKGIRDTIKKGGPEADLALARIATGTSIGFGAYELASQGIITGGMSADPAIRAMEYASGKQPYSILIDDVYYSFGRYEPLGAILGISADMYYIGSNASDAELEDSVGAVMMSAAKNLTSKTWLSGVSELMKVLNDPERYGSRYIQRMVGTIVPTGVAQVAKIDDPIMRDAQTAMDVIKSRIPGLSDELLPRRDIWGEPIERGGSLGPDIISAIYMSRLRDDPLSKEMTRLEIGIGRLRDTIGDVDLLPEEYDFMQQVAGKQARNVLMKVVSSPNWGDVPDDKKRDTIATFVRKSRELARKLTQAKFPDIIQRATDFRLEQQKGAKK